MRLSKLFYSVAVAGLLAFSGAANAVVWTFDLPSTSISGQNPPYPVVATLTLTQIGGGVQFTLDPNENSAGVNGPGQSPATSFIDQIDYVFKGSALTSSDVVSNSGAPVQSFIYETNQHNMDSSYTTQDQHIVINFVQQHGASQFSFNDTSTWTIAGVTLGDFTDTYATSNSHPSPTFGVISTSAYTLGSDRVCGSNLDGVCTGTTSNWVAGPVPAIPEPETYAMLLAGLGLIGFSARHRRSETF